MCVDKLILHWQQLSVAALQLRAECFGMESKTAFTRLWFVDIYNIFLHSLSCVLFADTVKGIGSVSVEYLRRNVTKCSKKYWIKTQLEKNVTEILHASFF